jgi:hypothetical protein
VSALVLGQVVAPGELLAALGALERLVAGVERAVVALEVLLTTETAAAQGADERLGRVLDERLLATAAAGRSDRGGGVLSWAGCDSILRLTWFLLAWCCRRGVITTGCLLLTLKVALGLVGRAALLLDRSPLGCGRSGHVAEVACSRGKGQAVNELLFEICETLVAQEVLVRWEGSEIEARALVAEELGVVGAGEVDKTGEVVFAIKLEQGLESGQTSELNRLGGLEMLDLASLTLENDLVLVVTGAESKKSRELSSCGDSEVAWVAEVVLGFDKSRAG